MSFGLMGGAMQAQGHAQLLFNMFVFGMDVQQAIDAARFRHMDGMNVSLEAPITDSVRAALTAMGHVVSRGARRSRWADPGDHSPDARLRRRLGSAQGRRGGGILASRALELKSAALRRDAACIERHPPAIARADILRLGRINRPLARCSSACAIQPLTRLMANVGVNSGTSRPRPCSSSAV